MMRYKSFIFCCLVLAYSMLLAHSFIPHHHHSLDDHGEEEAFYKNELADHDHFDDSDHTPSSFHNINEHHHEEESEDQNIPHFTHSPDFGIAIVKQFFSLPEFSKTKSQISLVGIDLLKISSDFGGNHFPDPTESPPPKWLRFYDCFSLRGPPSFSFS